MSKTILLTTILVATIAKAAIIRHYSNTEQSDQLNARTNEEPNYISKQIDYVSPAKYKFTYGVKDLTSGDQKTHLEEREGDSVKGSYSLVEPDGTIRIVRYTADKHGFHAVVEKKGEVVQYQPKTIKEVKLQYQPKNNNYL